MSNHVGNGSVPPFYKTSPDTTPTKSIPYREQRRRQIRQVLTLVAFSALTIAMLGGVRLLWDILTDGLELAGLFPKLVALGLSFILGWIVTLVCIRALGDLIMPLVVRVYILLTAAGILFLYARVIYKLFVELFDPAVHYLRYSFAIGAGVMVLVGLHLLIEDHDLRPFSIPFLIGGVVHLAAMVIHYVFIEHARPNVEGDVYFFGLMMVVSVLMLVHLGIFNLPRRLINLAFAKYTYPPSPPR